MKKLTLLAVFNISVLFCFAQDTLQSKYLDEIIITGQYEPQSAKRSLYQVKTIPLEKISAKGAVRLQDVLNTELNIRFSQDLALGGSNLSMQGLAGQNVKVLIDGVPMVGRQGTSNEININQINVNTIERIEIVEGPMSVVYGADALAGVINIITKKSVEGKVEVQVKLHEESVGSEYGWREGIHNESVGVGFSKKGWHTRVDASRNFFGGWQGNTTGREKQWHPKEQYLLSGLVGYEKEGTTLYYRADYLFEDIYNPANFQAGEALEQNYYTNRLMQQLQGTHTFTEKLQLNGALSYTLYNRETQTTTVDETTGDRRLALGPGLQEATKFNGVTLRSTLQYKMNGKFSLQPGIDFNYESGTGGRIKEGTQAIGDYAVFLSGEWNITSAIQIRPGLRTVYNTVYEAPPVIPSLNTKFQLNRKQDIRLSYGRGFRAPSLRELYFDFFDASHSIEGNPNLEAELSHSINGSWNWRLIEHNNLKYTTTLGTFYNYLENMIGYGQKPGNNLLTTYLNIDIYKTKGVTWNNAFKLTAWEINAGFSITGRYNQLNESYEGTEEFQWSPEVTTSATYKIPDIKLSFSLYYKYTGKTPYYELITDNGNTTAQLAEVAGYNWADLSVQKEIGKSFSLAGGVKNLFNVININSTAAASGAHSGSGPRPIGYGRSYFISISYSLNK